MARSKGKKVESRPTIDEIKTQPGKYVFVTYEGTKYGALGLPQLRPRFAGDVPEELNIVAWEAKIIAPDWLEDPRFVELYSQTEGIKCWKSDTMPPKRDLTIPPELEEHVSQARRAMAWIIATTDYTEPMQDMIHIENHDVPLMDAVAWEKNDLFPFLKMVQFYEVRLLNRPEVLRDIKKRLLKINAQKDAPLTQIEPY